MDRVSKLGVWPSLFGVGSLVSCPASGLQLCLFCQERSELTGGKVG